MRIVIDLQGAQTESRFRGIGRYSLSLAKAIASNAGDHEIWLVLNGVFQESVLSLRDEFRNLVPQERIRVFEVPLSVAENNSENSNKARVAEHIREYFLEQLSPDVVLVTSLFEGYVDDAVTSIDRFSKSYKTAVILYDLIPLMDEERYLSSNIQKEYYYKKIDSLQKADMLLAISEASKKECENALHIQSEKIVNISTAVDETFQPKKLSNEERQALFSKYGITRKMVMYAPGGFDIRKNFENLIIAYGKLPKNLRDAYQLAIVSKVDDDGKLNLQNIAKKASLAKDELIITGYVSDEELIAFYSSCALFVFASVHEGFGLPVLEAMACGAAVIGSNATSVPEVIGNEKAFFDPSSVESIANKMQEALESETLLKELKEHGLRQCKKFSWDESGKKAIEVMEQNARIHNDSKNTFQSLIEKLAKLAMNYSEDELKRLSICLANNQVQQNIYNELPLKINWKVEGPFDSSYSLALLNRETALALDEMGHNVTLHSTEGPGDFEPNPSFLETNPKIKELYIKSKQESQSIDVGSRILYPPRVADMKYPLNLLHHYAWEESAFPSEWVDDFNTNLDGLTCLSNHIEKILIDNGVALPMIVSNCGVDHWLKIKSDHNYIVQAKKFKFLHVSSCFPRKGADVLLKSFGESFTQKDDVSLIIKTFKNPHNEIHTWLAEAQAMYSSYPDVIIIEEDLSDEKLKALYEQCDCLVGPSRAEGFGLPFAEAMLSGLPVITTGWGGQLDFCTNETVWLVDYEFVPAKTHFELFNSVWAEPSMKHLSQLMLEVYQLPQDLREEKSRNGKKLLLKNFKWNDAAQRLVDFARSFSTQKVLIPKIGWVSTWNTKCGIATYSEHLINAMYDNVVIFGPHAENLLRDDLSNVKRCWQIGEEDDLSKLLENIVSNNTNILVIQFNYGFFSFEAFADFIGYISERKIKIIVMMHATTDPKHVLDKKLSRLVPYFEKCERLLVHSPADLNRLKAYGLVDNVALFPHGLLDWEPEGTFPEGNAFVVSSYGFFLPHKGLLELIESMKLLLVKGLNIKLRMINAQYPVSESEQIVKKARKLISHYKLEAKIELISDFLSDEECLKELNKADLVVFPYQETGESSSAAVRYGLASKKPVAVTPLAIFDDVSGAVYEMPGCSVKDIAIGIEQIMKEIINDTFEAKEMTEKANKWREAHSYSKVGYRLNNILNSVLRNC